MGDALQRAEVVLRARRAAADQQHRRAFELRVGDGGDAVGDAGSGGRQRHPEPAGQHRMRVRHVHGGAFVTHVDDSDTTPAELIPDRLDVPALQPEYPIHPLRDQKLRNQRGDRAVFRDRHGKDTRSDRLCLA